MQIPGLFPQGLWLSIPVEDPKNLYFSVKTLHIFLMARQVWKILTSIFDLWETPQAQWF